MSVNSIYHNGVPSFLQECLQTPIGWPGKSNVGNAGTLSKRPITPLAMNIQKPK